MERVEARGPRDAYVEGLARSLPAIAFRVRPGRPWDGERFWGDVRTLTGHRPSALLEGRAHDLLLAEDAEAVSRAHAALRRPGDGYRLVIHGRDATGGEIALLDQAWGVFGPDGTLEAVEGFATPLTAHGDHTTRARGLTHDLNNLLAVVLNAAACGRRYGETVPLVQVSLEAITTAGERMADLIRELLSVRSLGEPAVMHLNDVVEDMTPLLRAVLGPEIELVTSLGANSTQILVRRSDLERVILNLATNARSAIQGAGTLSVRTAVVSGADVRSVSLQVTDSGRGMSSEELTRLFTPGAMRKSGGHGLGLSIIRELVGRNGGNLNVSSRAESGTTFAIYFPVAQ